MEILLKILISLYAITGIISTIGFLPTIIELIKKIPSASINSYAIWTFTGCVGFLYSLFIVSDLLLEIVTGLTFLGCATILILSLRLKFLTKK